MVLGRDSFGLRVDRLGFGAWGVSLGPGGLGLAIGGGDCVWADKFSALADWFWDGVW